MSVMPNQRVANRAANMNTRPNSQRGRGLMVYPSGESWRRLLFRGPFYLWRMGLGRPLSAMMLLLTTRGRKSGLPRHAVVDCTDLAGSMYITPAWGERNLWYQNILADPRVTVQRHGKTWGAEARRVVDLAELESLYFQVRRSPVWKSYLEYWNVPDTLPDFLAARDRLIALRLDPLPVVPLSPQGSDLLWVWAVLGAGTWFFLRRRS
jgi:deazaflavin-dependent oxidoreductase (nitroreductase family)